MLVPKVFFSKKNFVKWLWLFFTSNILNSNGAIGMRLRCWALSPSQRASCTSGATRNSAACSKLPPATSRECHLFSIFSYCFSLHTRTKRYSLNRAARAGRAKSRIWHFWDAGICLERRRGSSCNRRAVRQRAIVCRESCRSLTCASCVFKFYNTMCVIDPVAFTLRQTHSSVICNYCNVRLGLICSSIWTVLGLVVGATVSSARLALDGARLRPGRRFDGQRERRSRRAARQLQAARGVRAPAGGRADAQSAAAAAARTHAARGVPASRARVPPIRLERCELC